MTKGIAGKELNPREIYADIIDHPHWESPKHPPMSLYDRAAQFSPFAALTGYEDMIGEEARLVDNRIELSEEELEELNRTLGRINEAIEAGEKPMLTITFFVPDPLKAGGIYETVTEKVRRIDPVEQKIILDRIVSIGGSCMEIQIADILEIEEEE
jgi:hypothetical protein